MKSQLFVVLFLLCFQESNIYRLFLFFTDPRSQRSQLYTSYTHVALRHCGEGYASEQVYQIYSLPCDDLVYLGLYLCARGSVCVVYEGPVVLIPCPVTAGSVGGVIYKPSYLQAKDEQHEGRGSEIYIYMKRQP